MLGKEFVINYIIKRHNSEQKELAFKIYVTDALYALARLNKRYFDIINKCPNESQRTSEEIVESICAQLDKLGGKEEDK